MLILHVVVCDKWGTFARAAVWRDWWGFQPLFSLQRAIKGRHCSPSELFWKGGWRVSKDMLQGTGVLTELKGDLQTVDPGQE